LVASGVIETRAHGSGRENHKVTVDIDQAIEADQEDYFLLDISGGWTKDVKASLALTPDGRLTSAERSSVGIGPRIMGAVVSVGTTLLGATLGLAKRDVGREGDGKADEGMTYERAHPELATCRASARAELRKLCSKQVDVVGIALDNGKGFKEAAGKIKSLGRLERALRESIAAVDAHEEAWQDSALSPRFEPYSFTLRTSDLTSIGHASTEPSIPTTNPMMGFYELTGRVVSIERNEPVIPGFDKFDSSEAKEHRGEILEGIAYRHAYPATIRIHKHADDADRSSPFVVDDEVEISVIDDLSPVGLLPLNEGMFKKGTVGVSFHESGTLASVSNEASSAVGTTVDVIAGIPASIAGTLESAANARAQVTALRGADRAEVLAKLETEKAILDTKIATEDLAATADLRQQKTRLQARIDLLTARSDLNQAAALWLYGEGGNPPSVA
jgi:hypothetical protein